MADPTKHYNRGIIESILLYIPGFKGYLQKDYRREADNLQRTWLIDRLNQAKDLLNSTARDLVEAGNLDLVHKIDQVKIKLEKVTFRLSATTQGYSGFFDFVQIAEAELDQVYAEDTLLLQTVDTIYKNIEALPHQTEGQLAQVESLKQQLLTVEQGIDKREAILKGLGESA